VIWLYNQQQKQSTRVTEKVYVNLAQVSMFWDVQQLLNMCFFATLNIRKFNGEMQKPTSGFDSPMFTNPPNCSA
jgi:hypothetical protein